MRHRGFISAEYIIYLAVVISLIISITPPLLRYFSMYQSYRNITNGIDEIAIQSQQYYAQSVLVSRCLPQTVLPLADLDVELVEGVVFDVSYIQTLTPNTKPLGIQVSVNITDSSLNAVRSWLKPDEVKGTHMLFNHPLTYDVSDWFNLDYSTGCLK